MTHPMTTTMTTCRICPEPETILDGRRWMGDDDVPDMTRPRAYAARRAQGVTGCVRIEGGVTSDS